MDPQGKIIVFDGVCEFCNRSVDFILKWERGSEFKFTANQNEAGREILRAHDLDPDQANSLFLIEHGKLYDRSTAALRIARRLRFPYRLLYGFIIVPKFLRDAVYKLIAKNRYRFMGKKDSCRIPSPAEMARFLH